MKKIQLIPLVLMLVLCAVYAQAAQIKVFVTGMNAIGAQNKDDMKATLQMLLSSRLNSDGIVVVGSEAEADVVVSGTYVTIGKIFSIDAVAKTPTGNTVTRAFVQGETQDELIPAVGKLAEKLSAALVKIYSGDQPVAAAQQPAPATVPPVAALLSAVNTNEQLVKSAPGGDFIKPRAQEATTNGWLSKRLTGAANLMATGLTLPDGSREVFLAEDQQLAYYRQGRDMNLVAEIRFKNTEKVISLDTISGSDGTLEIYVTIIRAGELASQVWQVKGDKLQLVAEKLPYYFRSAALAGGTKKLYAQAMGRGEDYFGDVAEATRSGSSISLKNPIKMPRYGTIYSFNQFRNSEGTTFTVVINPDGYLVVYDQQMSEIWRSNDKFGGSELYFQKDDANNVRVTGDKFRWIFMNQRIHVSSRGEIMVGKNDGFWVLGNARSYKSGAVYCLVWNGSSLDEKWRTRETQNYLPDYLVDDIRNELLILQTVQRAGFAGRGASSLSIRKIE